jgi:hypothetical protein
MYGCAFKVRVLTGQFKKVDVFMSTKPLPTLLVRVGFSS